MQFRTDIQTLRALAVAAVLLFHFQVPGFASGFLGVDIFFVISGYLMMALYVPEKGAIGFYERRAKRLLPAYFATILATLAISWFVTIPPDFKQVAEQAVWASALSSNVGYWMQNSYFSKIDFNPLLHLWSLGVELQFYLILPLIFWITRRFRWFLPLLVVASLILCLLLVTLSPKTAFFMMPARIWEFGFGMMAAQLSGGEAKNKMVGGCAALLLPLTIFIPVNGEIQDILFGHPGAMAVVVSLLTALALWGGFSFTPFKKIGDWSYSIYLAHFPALALVNYEPFGGTILGGWMAVPWTIIAAALLYRLFERGKLFTWPRAALATAMTGLAGLLVAPLQLSGFSPAEQKIFAALDDRAEYRCGKLFRITNPGSDTCLIWHGKGKAVGEIFLVGDSHADAVKQVFADAAGARGYAVRFAVANDPLLNPALGPEWVMARAKGPVVLHFFGHQYAQDKTGAGRVDYTAHAGIQR